jgi:protein TonB
MQIKKYENANLENRKGAYFAIGLLFVVALIYCLFELKFYDLGTTEVKKLHLDLIEAEVIPISQTTPPPPPPPPQSITQIEIVSDEEVIEVQLEIEDLEIDDDSKIDIEVAEYVADMPEEEEIVEEEIFTIVEKMPSFPGGVDALFYYLGSNISYPDMAKDARIEGKVYITFVVDRDGSIADVKVLRGIGGGCDEEAIRVVKSMPSWDPGEQRGKKVRVQYNLPINFVLK